ncbi:guanine deaminase [Bacillus rossius redtenbacheri]|uniref:guanine deaminase n=1 Tax=Bacillus rossius redtenbacheri TaxID=93214 RepID=UPI002FDD9361
MLGDGQAGAKSFIICGAIVHSTEPSHVTILEDGFVAVCDGKVAAVGGRPQLPEARARLAVPEDRLVALAPGQFLCPGLVDTHIHPQQYLNLGLGLDRPLLEWLDTYTFPLEDKFSDEAFARRVWAAVVRCTLAHGTTTACYFATVHGRSTLALAETVRDLGQRAVVGKVSMDRNCPAYLREATERSLSDTAGFLLAVAALKCDRVQPAITPRFAITCSEPLMRGLADLADKHNTLIQTHISENQEEVKSVLSLFPEAKNYTDVYLAAGLLGPKTVLAHGVHLADEELGVLAERGCSVAHCPNSNTALRSGQCDVRRLLAAGISVGLGTDVSGGFSPSMVNAMQSAVSVSTHLSFRDGQRHAPLNYQEVFHLATLGGATALSLGDRTGNFALGKDFDALVVDMSATGSGAEVVSTYTTAELLQKFIFVGGDRNVRRVYVAGRVVKDTAA